MIILVSPEWEGKIKREEKLSADEIPSPRLLMCQRWVQLGNFEVHFLSGQECSDRCVHREAERTAGRNGDVTFSLRLFCWLWTQSRDLGGGLMRRHVAQEVEVDW